MALHNELGKAGEVQAAIYLTNHGYRILHRNGISERKSWTLLPRKTTH